MSHGDSVRKGTPWMACEHWDSGPYRAKLQPSTTVCWHNHCPDMAMHTSFACVFAKNVDGMRSLHWQSKRRENDQPNRACELLEKTRTNSASQTSPVTKQR